MKDRYVTWQEYFRSLDSNQIQATQNTRETKEPMLTPLAAKARLINTSETNIDTDAFAGLAPITRIGSGEVRADMAITASTAAWDEANGNGNGNGNGTLSFGQIDVTGTVELKKTLIIANFANEKRDYDFDITFHHPGDEASGAVTFKPPKSVSAGATKPGKQPKFRRIVVEMEALFFVGEWSLCVACFPLPVVIRSVVA